MVSFERLRRLSDAERASRAINEADREARDREIDRLDTLGVDQASIAKGARLAPSQVSRIIAKLTAARQERQAREAPPQGPTGD